MMCATSPTTAGDRRRAATPMSAPNKSYDPVEVAVLAAKEVQRMLDDALAAIAGAASLDELKAARLAHAGDRAPIAEANAEIGALPPAARADAGRRVGAARAAIKAALAGRQEELEAERDRRALAEEAVDVTLPWDRVPPGARHPVTTVGERLADVFVGMGYEIAEGPEAEAEWYNFDALNFPPEHPAREMQDTIFVAGPHGEPRSGVVLRTHTSPVQIRSMLTRPLPLYVVSPGKCFRTDTLDATHSPVFHQIEGLAVDVSMECHVCRGESARPGAEPCRVCRSQGWIEIAGCGMVNPRVLVACGIDPDRYSGFAFGLGIERTLMISRGVTDIRDAVEGDVRFSRALGMEA